MSSSSWVAHEIRVSRTSNRVQQALLIRRLFLQLAHSQYLPRELLDGDDVIVATSASELFVCAIRERMKRDGRSFRGRKIKNEARFEAETQRSDSKYKK